MLDLPAAHSSREAPASSIALPIVPAGKHLMQGGEPFYIRGVTYGTFAPDEKGFQFPARARVAEDFRAIRLSGFNSVRTYTVPPDWVFELASACQLKLLVGLTWEQHVTFLDDRSLARDIRNRLRAQVEMCQGHPGILGFTLGNEIPASIVRWHGRDKVQRFLLDLYDITKSAHPEALATYVNFPTTEYLELPFLDFLAFNVYLEDEVKLSAYLKRLHNIAGDQPLVMTEIGLDSRRNGEAAQAESLDWQIRTAFREGCAGAFVYAWTDEWYRGGHMIEDWDFGLTTRERRPKMALPAVQSVMEKAPFGDAGQLPSISVVVCSYNGSATIRDTLKALSRLDYPDYEVIVVNDGSTDSTPEIAKEYQVRLISTENQGLGQARNEGCAAARGEIIVYTDDDAYPPPNWLRYLAADFMRSDHACIGGPNLVPPEDGWVGQCVADSPGGPLHVLLTDDIAEHVPGCNMAFRKERLQAIGGFDPIFRSAGDDVDVCWRLQDKGWTIGFSPAAMVWHHRRATAKRYWGQQVGYGKAEALLEQKWPGRFTALGHMTWSGRIYGRGLALPFVSAKPRVYQGVWGLAPYQGLYQPAPNHLLAIALTPEWIFLAAVMLGLGLTGIFTPVTGLAGIVFAAMLVISLTQAFRGAAGAKYLVRTRNLPFAEKARSFLFIFFFHLIQPAARLWGRLKHGLTPWRSTGRRAWSMPCPQTKTIWSETWRAPENWLHELEAKLANQRANVTRGGDYDDWDLQVRGGMLAHARLVIAQEEHGAGKQNIRFRIWPVCSGLLVCLGLFSGIMALSAFLPGYLPVAAIAGLLLAVLIWQAGCDWSLAAGQLYASLDAIKSPAPVCGGHGDAETATMDEDTVAA